MPQQQHQQHQQQHHQQQQHYQQHPQQQQQQPQQPSSDAFVNSLIQELKTIKLSNNNNLCNSSVDSGVMPMGNSSIIKSNGNNNQNQSAWSKQPLWGPPATSPTSSIKTQYHSAHSSSKESLWQSTQSSPNSSGREQLQNTSSPSSASSTSSNTSLWENPISKMPQASLMYNKESYGSIWTLSSPTTTQSPVVNKLSNLWEDVGLATPTTGKTSSSLYGNGSMFNHQQKADQGIVGLSLIRPQDISNDVWSNGAVMTKTKDPVGSLWANPTPSYPSNNKYNGGNHKNHAKRVSPPPPAPQQQLTSNHQQTNIISMTNNTSTAASSCLQLFSDEFLNYLNMIN